MQEIISAILIGIVQGLAEFLPVSSSGHIELGQALLGLDYKDKEAQFSIILHIATALSTIVVFRKDLGEIFRGLFQFKNNEAFQFAVKIVLSMIPAAFVGIVFEEQLEQLFNGKILLVAYMLIVTGVLLFFASRAKNTGKDISYGSAILIGIAQAIAITPGISRSGATISTSVLLGIDREKAARFSFLMVIPLIFGKMSKDIIDGNAIFPSELYVPFGAAFIAAFLTGLLACKWMISIVKKSKLIYFSIYCILVGLAAIIALKMMG